MFQIYNNANSDLQILVFTKQKTGGKDVFLIGI